jgi:hypothetical protein
MIEVRSLGADLEPAWSHEVDHPRHGGVGLLEMTDSAAVHAAN